jgi:hypothetical protein
VEFKPKKEKKELKRSFKPCSTIEIPKCLQRQSEAFFLKAQK